MTTAVYPGTFDPFTLGHLDVLKRAASLFDRVILAVAESEKKKTLFTLEERIALAQASCEEEQGLENVTVEGFRGLLCDFAKARGVTVKSLLWVAMSPALCRNPCVVLCSSASPRKTQLLGID